jgi:hypothetical protein
MRFYVLLLTLICVHTFSFSQNLVRNPSFEDYSSCPQGPSELENADFWHNPFDNLIGDTCSTSDLFNSCTPLGGLSVGVPANILGTEPAHTGDGYAGIILFEGFTPNLLTCDYISVGDEWREYVQGELSEPLVSGQQYCVSFYVSLADNVKWASDDFGVYFSNTLLSENCGSVSSSVLQYEPQLENCDSVITETSGWTRLQWNYVATGGEQFFTIGNFKDDNNTTVDCVNPTATNPYSYYYIDDVSVTAEACCFAEIELLEESVCVTDPEFDLQVISLCGVAPIGTWSGTGIIDATSGTFDPATAGEGVHEVVFSLDCGFNDTTTITVNNCIDLLACATPGGDINITNGSGPFIWSQLVDTVDCSACQEIPLFPPCQFPPGCSVTTQEWVPFTSGQTITPNGNWPLMVEDANENTLIINAFSELPQCESGCFISVDVPTQITVCEGETATAVADVNGAQGVVDYAWNTLPVQTNDTATGLAAGEYYVVTVTDESECTAQDSVLVVEQVCVAPTACVTPSGDMYAEGNGPFTWFEFADSTDCSDCAEIPGFPPCTLPPGCSVIISAYQQFATGDLVTPTGNWPVVLVDALGDTLVINSLAELPACTQSCFISVDVPDQAFVCSGQSNAQVTAQVSNAVGTPSYSWSTNPIQTSATATGLSSGEYVVVVTDDNNCEASDTVEVLSLPPLNLEVQATDSLCLGLTSGAATVIASGGSGSYEYSWNTSPVQNTASATGLSVGVYTVTVTDITGCSGQASVTIHQKGEISVDVTTNGDVCPESNDGEATATASNGSAPYTYSWNTSPVQSGTIATGLAPGDYQVTATDQDGCQGIGSVTIAALPAVEADAGTYTTICLGQSTDLLATGGVDYEWSIGEFGATIEVAPEETTLYTVTVTDGNGCTGTDTVTVFVVPVPQVSIEEVDSVVCDVEPPFQIVGIPPGGVFSGTGITQDGFFYPLDAGDGIHLITYTLESVENCEVDTTIQIRVDETLCDVTTPSIFNPNSDFNGQTDFCGNIPQNDVFALPCLELYPGNRVAIYDRWGRKLYDQENYQDKPWDGGNQSDGVFYYILELPNEDPIKGFFHLVK